jgi:hypothetical protein
MQRLTLLALFAPLLLLSEAARAQPLSTGPTTWPADAPIPEAPAAPTPPTGWDPTTAPAVTPPITEPPTATPSTGTPPTGPGTVSAFALYATRPPVASALYLQGFDVAWDARPGRLRSLVFVADAAAPNPGTAPSGALLVRVQGGAAAGEAVDDRATADLAYGGMSSTNAPIYRGAVRTTLTGGTSPGAPREPAIATIPVEVPVAGVTADSAAVFIQGFAFESEATHADGFVPRVLSVQLGPATITDGIARFDVTVELDAAVAPGGLGPTAGYGADVEVGWALVPAAADRVHRVDVSGGAPHGVGLDGAPATTAAVPLPLGVDLHPGTTDVAAGLSGFRVAIDGAGTDTGRSLRTLGVTLDEAGVDPWRARWDGVVEARFANMGGDAAIEGVSLQADVTVLELAEGERAWSGRWQTPLAGADAQLPYPGTQRTGRP